MSTKSLFQGLILAILALIPHQRTQAQTAFSTKEAGHAFWVDIPEYMTRTYQLSPGATLQYQNNSRETYLIIIDEPKQEFIELGSPLTRPEEYYEIVTQDFFTEDTQVGELKRVKVNDNEALQSEIIKPFEEIEIFYLMTIIESEDYFYQILAWTLVEYKDQYLADFQRIANSLKE